MNCVNAYDYSINCLWFKNDKKISNNFFVDFNRLLFENDSFTFFEKNEFFNGKSDISGTNAVHVGHYVHVKQESYRQMETFEPTYVTVRNC